MPIDTSLIGAHVPPVERFSPLKAMKDARTYAEDQQKDRDDQAKREDEAVVQAIMQQHPEDPDTAIKVMKQRGFTRAAMGFQKLVTEERTKQADLDHKDLANRSAEGKLLADTFGGDDTITAWTPDQIALGKKSPHIAAILAQPPTPQLIQRVANFGRTEEQRSAAVLKAIKTKALKDWMAAFAIDPESMETQQAAAFYMGPEAWSKALVDWQQAETAQTRANIDMAEALKPDSKKGTPSDYAQFLNRYATSLGKTPETLTADEELAARKKYGQADDAQFRGFAPIIIQGPQGPMVTNSANRQSVAPVMGPDGKPLAAAPTAEQKNRIAGRHSADVVLASIEELSEKINTGRGAVARVSGMVERAKAQANLNDDLSEYQAVVSGFTPLLARALGHVGVLTEQDVQSVRNMLPKPEDSKSVRDRKIARIASIMSQMPGAQEAETAAPAAGAGPKPTGRFNPATGKVEPVQ